MKPDIHPEYVECTITCACGAVRKTHATVAEIRLDICGACHPFFTGEEKLIDTAGRVERFRKREAKTEAQKKKKEAEQEPEEII